jgi:putative DNA methylase
VGDPALQGEPNINARKSEAICLACHARITGSGEKWHVKSSLREWNRKLEEYLRGEITLEQLRQAPARPRILVKVKIRGDSLHFEPATSMDDEKLWRALEKLRQMWGDPDIPTEELWKYHMGTAGQLSIWIWGFDKFYKLFNPRQLLTLVKLTKLIREAGKRIEEEKLREGWDREKAFKYAEAITTYLAIALVRYAEHTSLATPWTSSTGFGSPLALKPANAMTFRGIAMVWNWCETVPFIDFAGSYIRGLNTNIDGLSYLVSAVFSSPSKVRVLLDDATVLGKLDEEKFDLIVTDPPYRDDVAYAELSDFYYVWLKRALSDISELGGLLFRQPRFISEAFFSGGAEIEVQWKHFADKEVSEAMGRSKFFGSGIGSTEYFKKLLSKAFSSMYRLLKDDGLLISYYSHTSPEAWEALLDAGWMNGRMRITATHALATESVQRVTARGKVGLDISIVAVWRKGVSGQSLAGEVYSDALMKCTDYASTLLKRGLEDVDLFVSVLGCVLSIFTKYDKIIGVKTTRELVENYVYPATGEAIARALGSKELAVKLSSTSLFYLLSKVLIGRRPRQLRRVLDRSTATILAISARLENKSLEDLGLVEREGEKLCLLEPSWNREDLVNSVRSVLEGKGINLTNPTVKTPIDLLHMLEYYAVTLPRSEFNKKAEDFRARYPALYTEALSIVRVLGEVLPPTDPESELVKRIINSLTPTQTGLDRWVSGGEY